MTLAGLFPSLSGLPARKAAVFGVYVALTAVLVGIATTNIVGALEDFAKLGHDDDQRREIERRISRTPADKMSPVASALWLTAKTTGLAGATLQDRVETAARKAGARVLSSRVDVSPDSVPERDGVSYVGEFELAAPALQALLYDLEAGAPLIFVDALTVQAQPPASGAEGPLRATIGVTGPWRQPP